MNTRRRAFKSPGEQYKGILDVVTRYAIHFGDRGVSFTCKKVMPYPGLRVWLRVNIGTARKPGRRMTEEEARGLRGLRLYIPFALSTVPPPTPRSGFERACANACVHRCFVNTFSPFSVAALSPSTSLRKNAWLFFLGSTAYPAPTCTRLRSRAAWPTSRWPSARRCPKSWWSSSAPRRRSCWTKRRRPGGAGRTAVRDT